MTDYKNDELAALAMNENYETVNQCQATLTHNSSSGFTRYRGTLIATQCASGRMRIAFKIRNFEAVEIVSSTGEVNKSVFKLTIQ